MTISYNWLTDYLKSELTAEEISIILTDIGLEVEGFEKIETIKGGLRGVVVGEVLTREQHPDADRLSLTTVDVGGEKPLQIVCGAPNVDKGQKVVVATVGTTLYPKGDEKGFAIGEAKIRGVESFGMICSEVELGLGEDSDGIMVLEPTTEVGMSAAELFDVKEDYIIEIGLTANRADAMSHYGVARDLAVWLKANDKEHQLLLPSVEEFKADNNERVTAIEVEDSTAAPRYAGVTISGVEVAPSPKWLRDHLESIGLQPRNNVVDITNFVLHEMGQPLHAFDADKIEGEKIVVKRAEAGSKFTTLDDEEHTLTADDLMICSATKPLCIAGVLGGAESGVSDSTTTVFLESAYFNPVTTRQTARRFGLNTDASFRFERGIDPNGVIYGLKRAALLIKEIAGGTITSEIEDIYPAEIEPFRYNLSLPYMNRLLGQEIAEPTVRKILEALEVKVESEKEGVLAVAVPPYRVDVRRQADLIEDILRIYGYNKIEIPKKVNSTISYEPNPNHEKLTNIVGDMLSANGFAEIMSNSLTKSAYYAELESYKAENCVKMLNPLSSDLDVLRQTLLFGFLEAMERNVHRRIEDLKMYEFGSCYHFDPKRSDKIGLAPYSETNMLAIAMTGSEHHASWNVEPKEGDFFGLRAILEKLLKRFAIDIYSLPTKEFSNDIYAQGLKMDLRGREFLQIGVIAPQLSQQFDIETPVFYLELDFSLMMEATVKHHIEVEEISKFPSVTRDLALLVDNRVTFGELRRLAHSTERKLLKSVALFDVYEGENLPEGKKSYAVRFTLEDKESTLTDKQIEKAMGRIAARFKRECGAEIRA